MADTYMKALLNLEILRSAANANAHQTNVRFSKQGGGLPQRPIRLVGRQGLELWPRRRASDY